MWTHGCTVPTLSASGSVGERGREPTGEEETDWSGLESSGWCGLCAPWKSLLFRTSRLRAFVYCNSTTVQVVKVTTLHMSPVFLVHFWHRGSQKKNTDVDATDLFYVVAIYWAWWWIRLKAKCSHQMGNKWCYYVAWC